MSAEKLREAAALMRSRAEAARAGKWRTEPSVLTPDATLVVAEWQRDLRRVATCSGSVPEGNQVNAEHIAAWHPAVALAVADWLEAVASHLTGIPGQEITPNPIEEKALAVAAAYLGEAS